MAGRIDLDRLRAQLTPATRLIVVNLPHNPTGVSADPETFRRLVELAEEAGAYLLVDEVYRFLEFDSAQRLPAGADASSRAISLGVMSKSFALAGLRIGWLATHDRDLLDRLAAVQGLHHDLLGGAVGDPGADRPARVATRCSPGPGGSSPPTSSCSTASSRTGRIGSPGSVRTPARIGFPRLTVPGVRIDDWAAELVEAEGVLLLPGSQFGHGGNHFRIGFGRTQPAGGAGGARGLRAAHAALTQRSFG